MSTGDTLAWLPEPDERSTAYANFGKRGKESIWITLRALKVLKNAGIAVV